MGSYIFKLHFDFKSDHIERQIKSVRQFNTFCVIWRRRRQNSFRDGKVIIWRVRSGLATVQCLMRWEGRLVAQIFFHICLHILWGFYTFLRLFGEFSNGVCRGGGAFCCPIDPDFWKAVPRHWSVSQFSHGFRILEFKMPGNQGWIEKLSK